MKILLLQATDLHLGYLGCYGNGWIETPHLDRLAAEGVVFDQHFLDASAPGSLSQPGLTEIVVAQRTRRGTIRAALHALDPLQQTDPCLLRVQLPSLAPPWKVPARFLKRTFTEDQDEPAEETEGEADEAPAPRPPLTPWLDPAPGPIDLDDTAWERLQNTYAAVVSHLDAQLGLLLDVLEECGLLKEALVIFTAERGLALGEHGILGDCRPWLHEELIHLPLIIRFPDGAEAGRRVAALTQPADLGATVRTAFGAPAACPGHDLLPLARGAVAKVREVAVIQQRLGEREEWGLRTPEWSFLLPVRQAVEDTPRPVQLYVKPEDRWEVNNVVQQHWELAEGLEKQLREAVAATQPRQVVGD